MNQQYSSQRWHVWVFACLCLGVGSLGWGPTALADEASDLAQRVHERPNGRDLTTLSRMVLTEKGRASRGAEPPI